MVELPIRICGQEVISTVSNVKKSYIFGYEPGDPDSLSDSQRYHTISQNEFKDWFQIDLGADDYCAQYGFALLDKDQNGWSNLADPRLRYDNQDVTAQAIKIDKTRPTDAIQVFLQAQTIGGVKVQQEIEWVVCDQNDGSVVTPPPPALNNWHQELRALYGFSQPAAAPHLYLMIPRGAGGSAANIPFTQWQIEDGYQGCGVFEKYAVTSTYGSDAGRVQYPEPGYDYTYCDRIDRCHVIRVTDTGSTRTINFMLQLWPNRNQHARNITVTADVTPCIGQTLSVPVQPDDLVLDRQDTDANGVSEHQLDPYYRSKLVTTHGECQVLRFQLQDGNGAESVIPEVTLTNPDSPSTSKLVVKTYAKFTKNFRIKGWSFTHHNYMTLKVRVCGEETLSLADPQKKTFIFP